VAAADTTATARDLALASADLLWDTPATGAATAISVAGPEDLRADPARCTRRAAVTIEAWALRRMSAGPRREVLLSLAATVGAMRADLGAEAEEVAMTWAVPCAKSVD
jgi:hypothetical protein